MRNVFIVLGIFVLISIGILYINFRGINLSFPSVIPPSQSQPSGQNDIPETTVIAENLDTPWSIVFLPGNSMLVTERPGRVRFIDSSGKLDPTPVAEIDKVKEIGEGGLLGMATALNFSTNHYVYLYYTYGGSGTSTSNRVVRMTYENKRLTDEKIIVDGIPGAPNHNGGRIKFGPDGYLYITTGDAENPSEAQDTNSLAGKILRVSDTGQQALGNPFGNLVYSWGHRNPQGLAWDSNGQLWETEHGRSGVLSGLDELNIIESGQNYGWPLIQGDQTKAGMITPVSNSGETTTWAPAGAAFFNGSLFYGGLRGQTLYEAVIRNSQVATIKEHFKGKFGRIREVVIGPDDMLYITTSNRDGRGNPASSDDKIIKVNPKKL